MTDPRVPTETLEEIRKRARRVLRDTGRGLFNLTIGSDELARDVLSLAERVEAAKKGLREMGARYTDAITTTADDRVKAAEARAARYEKALREVLADDGNCTAAEPRDLSCPRCKARAVLAESPEEEKEG